MEVCLFHSSQLAFTVILRIETAHYNEDGEGERKEYNAVPNFMFIVNHEHYKTNQILNFFMNYHLIVEVVVIMIICLLWQFESETIQPYVIKVLLGVALILASMVLSENVSGVKAYSLSKSKRS